MTKLRSLIALAAILVPALPASIGSAQPPPPPPPPTWPPVPPPPALPAGPPTAPVQPLEYAVKFVCGQSGGAVAGGLTAPGFYSTLINVHNPGPPQWVTHKVTLALIAHSGGMTPFQPYILMRYDDAIDFDCRWIRGRLQAANIPIPALFTGFVVLQSRRELDVVAVYTAAPLNPNQVSTMHTERVPVRRVIP
jgi:hypothetical protein